jgi:DNA replication protein DnaC
MEKWAPRPEKIIQEVSDELPLPDLTPEEEQAAIEAGILAAKEAKALAIRKKEYWDKVTAEPEIVLYDTAQLRAKLKASITPSGKPFKIDNDNRQIAELLCLYFASDPNFEKLKDFNGLNYSLNKGLCLMGNVGVGKTFMMGVFHLNQNQSYVMVNCRKIEGLWVDQMSAKEKPLQNVIDQYSREIKASINGNPFGQQVLGVCFDDLGTETRPSKAYGEEKHVLAEILMNRYESGLPFNYTHITTNLSAHDIGIEYGTRVKDRFREMFNLIQFNNEAKTRR